MVFIRNEKFDKNKLMLLKMLVLLLLFINFVTVYQNNFNTIQTNSQQSSSNSKFNDAQVNTNNLLKPSRISSNNLVISSNNDFITCGCTTGSGTKNNPYLLNIDISSQYNVAFSISDTTAYFIIKNSIISGELNDPIYNPAKDGIAYSFNNVINGMIINSNATYNQGVGFEITNSHDLQFINDSIINNEDDGIFISNSYSITFTNNTSSNNAGNGFDVDHSVNLTLDHNTANSNTNNGFQLNYSNNTIISNNTAIGNVYPIYLNYSPTTNLGTNSFSGNTYNYVYTGISQTQNSQNSSNTQSSIPAPIFDKLVYYLGIAGPYLLFLFIVIIFLLIIMRGRSRKTKKPLNYASNQQSKKRLSDKELMKKYDVNSAKVARDIEEGGFPSREIYQKAIAEGFTNYEPYRIKENRKEKLVKIMKVSSKISKDDLMKYMGIQNHTILIDWLINLPEGSPITIDGYYVVFKKDDDVQQTDEKLSNDIDELLKSFEAPGRKKL